MFYKCSLVHYVSSQVGLLLFQEFLGTTCQSILILVQLYPIVLICGHGPGGQAWTLPSTPCSMSILLQNSDYIKDRKEERKEGEKGGWEGGEGVEFHLLPSQSTVHTLHLLGLRQIYVMVIAYMLCCNNS